MRTRHSLIKAALIPAIAIGSLVAAPSGTRAAEVAPPNNGKAIGTVQDLARAFRNVGRIVEPSVVNIKVRKIIQAQPARSFPRGGPFDDPFFRRFFDRDGDGEPDFHGFDGMPEGEQIGQGSGVIVDVEGKTGYLVTNHHVAGEADEMEIILNDGRVITNGKLVGSDPRTDIAVVKIEADDLVVAKWGDSTKLEKGDWVLAFGSPFGYVGSMTHGIVSATGRNDLRIIPQGYEDFIQIDAPINPGNSGGPLTNIYGEVVGINTAIASRTGGFQGIGFAIPSHQARQIYQTLREKGKVVRGWLGVSIASVNDEQSREVARSFGYKGTTGALVQEVLPDTPAAGKLEAGDIITQINGRDVRDSGDLRNTIAMIAPGTEVKMKVFRNGKTMDVAVKLGDQPAKMGVAGAEEDGGEPEAGEVKLGVRLNDLTADMAQQLGLKAGQTGAVIETVEPRSVAARAGLRPGDVISRVGDTPVRTAREAIDAIRKQDMKKGLRLYIVSREGSRFVFVQAK